MVTLESREKIQGSWGEGMRKKIGMGKAIKGDFKVMSNVLFPKLASGKTGVHFIIFLYNLHICWKYYLVCIQF